MGELRRDRGRATLPRRPALVIAGSDKRGTIYGIYEVHRASLHVLPGRVASREPAVKYRGIFLNDEAPALTRWTGLKFDDRDSRFYAKVFELILRLRGNYLWPAMRGDAFHEDDPKNPRLADEYGIVMGTSHHEPMRPVRQEWFRSKSSFGNGAWNYATSAEGLREFWRKGIALPSTDEEGNRRGGSGVYYHFDYVDGSRSYK